MEPVVRLRSVVALLGGFPALAGADLTVDAGEAVLLRGPNGAGKSTVLRVCAGLVPVASGEASVLGVDLTRDRTLGAPSNRHARPRRISLRRPDRARERRLRRRSRRRRQGARSTARWLGLASTGDWPRRASRRCRPASGGGRRSPPLVARQAELWLLDEPHAGLDDDGRDLVDGVVREAIATGATVVMASHDTDRAIALASRVLTVAGGMITDDEGAASVFRDAALVAGKDLRIERRSRVTTQQIAPFAILVLVLFAFALDPDRGVLGRASVGPVLARGRVLRGARRATRRGGRDDRPRRRRHASGRTRPGRRVPRQGGCGRCAAAAFSRFSSPSASPSCTAPICTSRLC